MKVLKKSSRRSRNSPYGHRPINQHGHHLNQQRTEEFKQFLCKITNDCVLLETIIDKHVFPAMELVGKSRAFASFVSLKFLDQAFDNFPELLTRLESFNEELRLTLKTENHDSYIGACVLNFLSEGLFTFYQQYASVFVQTRTSLDRLYYEEEFFQFKSSYRKSVDLRRMAMKKTTLQTVIGHYMFPLYFLDFLLINLKQFYHGMTRAHPDYLKMNQAAKLAKNLWKNVHLICDVYAES